MSLSCSLWHHNSQFFTKTQHRRDNRLDYSQFWGLFPERLERITFTSSLLGTVINWPDKRVRHQTAQLSNCWNTKRTRPGSHVDIGMMMKHQKPSPTCYGALSQRWGPQRGLNIRATQRQPRLSEQWAALAHYTHMITWPFPRRMSLIRSQWRRRRLCNCLPLGSGGGRWQPLSRIAQRRTLLTDGREGGGRVGLFVFGIHGEIGRKLQSDRRVTD